MWNTNHRGTKELVPRYPFAFCLISGYAPAIQEHEDMTKMAPEEPFVDPFADPVAGSINVPNAAGRGNSIAAEDTLAVGRNASLTLGTDSLIVLGKSRFHPMMAAANRPL